MSHVTAIKTKTRDLDALEEAAIACDLVFRRGITRHKTYGGAYQSCEHVLALRDATASDYEIGVVKAIDGSGDYDMKVDWWQQSRLAAAVGGNEMQKLKQEYAVAVASKKAKAKLAPKGFRQTRELLASGTVRLRLRRM
jgi:hypothetical protein